MYRYLGITPTTFRLTLWSILPQAATNFIYSNFPMNIDNIRFFPAGNMLYMPKIWVERIKHISEGCDLVEFLKTIVKPIKKNVYQN